MLLLCMSTIVVHYYSARKLIFSSEKHRSDNELKQKISIYDTSYSQHTSYIGSRYLGYSLHRPAPQRATVGEVLLLVACVAVFVATLRPVAAPCSESRGEFPVPRTTCLFPNQLTLYGHTLKPQSSRPIHSNTVIGTLAVDGWAVTFGTARRGLSGLSPLLAVPNVTAHPSTANVPTSYYSMWHYDCLCTLQG